MAEQITREQWAAIGRDYKGIGADGKRYVFSGCLPDGWNRFGGGTVLVEVEIEKKGRAK
jgi:hypothetical protein